MSTYVLRETIVSMVINTLFSLAFFLLIFGRGAAVPVWGMGAFAFDTVPQSLAIAAMSTLVPGAIAARRVRQGTLPPLASLTRLPRNIWLRAALVAAVAALAGSALVGGLLWALGLGAIGWWPALLAKLAYGAALAAIVTPPTLKAALH